MAGVVNVLFFLIYLLEIEKQVTTKQLIKQKYIRMMIISIVCL